MKKRKAPTLWGSVTLVAAITVCEVPLAHADVAISGQGACAYTTITDAVAAAVDGDTLLVEEGVYFESGITISAARSITIKAVPSGNNCALGIASTRPVVNGSGNQVFFVDNDSSLTLEMIELQNGSSIVPNGGLIQVGTGAGLGPASLALVSSKLSGGDVAGKGGLIYIGEDDSLVVEGGTVGPGESRADGGLIYVDTNASATISNVLLTSGESVNGGCIYAHQATVNLQGTATLRDCFAVSAGGAIYADESALNMTGDAVVENSGIEPGGIIRTNMGGGMYATGSSLLTVDSQVTIRTNEAGVGGGIYLNGGLLSLSGTVLSNVAFTGDGGGVYIDGGGRISADGAAIESNLASDDGGGVYIDSTGNQSFVNSRVYGNSADSGAGIYASGGGLVAVTSDPATCDPNTLNPNEYCSEISENTASGTGGGVYTAHPTQLSTNRTAYLGNTAGGFGGGAIYAGGILANMNNCLVAGNAGASAVDVQTVAANIGSNTFVDNAGTGLELDLFAIAGIIANNIFWNNGLGFDAASSTIVTGLLCNDIQNLAGVQALVSGGTLTVTVQSGNLNVAPQFTMTSRGIYRLSNVSPVVDQGCTSTDGLDLDHFQRVLADIDDMGCFELP